MRRAGLVGGLVGAAAALAAGGIAERLLRSRRWKVSGPLDFSALRADRTSVVRTEDGVALQVEEVGPLDAPVTAVFVHGFTLSARSFHFQRVDLAERFGDRLRMVFYDQRSHGRSGASVPGGATMEQLGRDLYAVLAATVPRGPVILVGHSMGGMAIQHYAAGYPQTFDPAADPHVSGVVLIASSAGRLDQVAFGLPLLFGRVQGMLTGTLLRAARKRANLVESGRRLGSDIGWVITRRLSFGDRAIRPEIVDFLNEIISATPIVAIADFHHTLMGHDGRAGLPVLRDVDTMIVAGAADVMTPLSHSEALADELPKAELVVLAGAGHAVLMEKPTEVDDAIAVLVERALDD